MNRRSAGPPSLPGLGREIVTEGVAVRDGIDWAEVGAGGRFEKIVSTLLSTLHPDSERIDGTGGDGGRDHQWRTGEHLELWQSSITSDGYQSPGRAKGTSPRA